jgi:purine-binding chemotaxis protein CheW
MPVKNEQSTFVVFTVEVQRFALHLEAVKRIVRMVEITPLPHSPGIVAGVIDAAGTIMPVINLRKHLGLSEREVRPADRLIIADTGSRTVALAVDAVQGVERIAEAQIANTGSFFAGLGEFEGVAHMQDGLLLIQDLHRFLTPEESRSLDAALDVARKDPVRE